MQTETEIIIANIIQHEMNLLDNQIWIYNQNFVMPRTSGLFVVVGFGWDKVISNKTEMLFNSTSGEPYELQSCTCVENIVISLMSENAEARQRKSEAILAMTSIYAQQMMEKYNFKIAKIPKDFVNVSDAEGSTTINRYNITIPVMVWYQKEHQLTSTDYYDDFTGNVIIEERFKSFDLEEIKGET